MSATENKEDVEAESRLIAEKDTVIKALADALVKHARQAPCPNCGGVGSRTCATCDHGEKPTHHPEVIAALRLAGRL